MKQEYFVVVLAHSLRGRLRRIHIPHQAVYATLVLTLFGTFSLFGFVASYARMALKVANYNALKRDADQLRIRYQNLQKVVRQTDEQLASLEVFAKEVTLAYGIKQKLEGPSDISAEGKLAPTFADSVAEYNYLKTANSLALGSRGAWRLQSGNSRPAIWPIAGRLMGAFGNRTDPFSGEGEFHKGVDIVAPTGTPVEATADGIVVRSEVENGYGRLVVVDHGNGYQTYYAHLSKFFVQVGQDVRRGELVGAVGTSGRVTAPHLHYEVRLNGGPVNPGPYLAKSGLPQVAIHRDLF